MPVYRIGQKNVLFIHVPKTAGMALDAHLSSHGKVVFNTRIKVRGGVFGPRHQPAAVLQTIYLPEMIDYAFMVVRHPVARLISEYRYQRQKAGLHLSRLRFLGFDTWLRYSLWRYRTNPDWRVGHFRPQVGYECFDCDVFRYEDGLDKVRQGVERATGIAIPDDTPRQNVSPHRAVRVSRASLDLIAKFYAPDFSRYDYAIEVPKITGVTYSG